MDLITKSVVTFFFSPLTLANQKSGESSSKRPARDSPTLTLGFGVHGRSALITTKNLFPDAASAASPSCLVTS